MYFRNLTWTVSKLLKKYSDIDPKPPYQRGDVWSRIKQQLLIDSILNGYDIPKLYLRHIKTSGGVYDYELADGQQRITAIHGFIIRRSYPLGTIEGLHAVLSGKSFDELSAATQRNILDYEFTVAVAYDTTNDQIRELFARLQKGDRLTPAELRNSVPSKIGDIIRAMAITHRFFTDGPYSIARYKTDDLLAHAFAIEFFDGTRDLKAPDLMAMYKDHAQLVDMATTSKVARILKFMYAMQGHSAKCIKTKWGFVDVYGVLSRTRLVGLKPAYVAQRYMDWEGRRRKHSARPEALVSRSHSPCADRDLYKYLVAFQREGATKKNLSIRREVLASAILP